MDQKQKKVRSTKTNKDIDENVSKEPVQEENNLKIQHMFVVILEEGKVYSDQTGWFLHTSSKGTKYIMVLYVYNANDILTIGLKNRTEGELLQEYQLLYKYLQSKGYKLQ
eukprot:15218256-Ditylum_brightwellii.AAC.1